MAMINTVAHAILVGIKQLKPGEVYRVAAHTMRDAKISWHDPFGSPTLEEKAEWLRDRAEAHAPGLEWTLHTNLDPRYWDYRRAT